MHPEIPTCEDCRRWVYDPKDNWRRTEKPKGNPLARIKGTPTPCGTCPKSEGGKPTPVADLSERNWQAYQHYQECRAVGEFPRDAIVRRNAAVIRQIEDQAARCEAVRLTQALALVGGLGRGRA